MSRSKIHIANKRATYNPIADLKKDVGNKSRALNGVAKGGMELAYYRGYQSGYEQCMKDIEAGCVEKDHGLTPSRSSVNMQEE